MLTKRKKVFYISAFYCHKKQNLKFELCDLCKTAKQNSSKAESFRALGIAIVLLKTFLII